MCNDLPDQRDFQHRAHLRADLFLRADEGFKRKGFGRYVVMIIEEISSHTPHGHQDHKLLGRYPET
ncbi:Uncharacterised protein [Mycobacterium tuberculosis]|nr:Uncharacterised protein [Mycobacterium tuberculosis]